MLVVGHQPTLGEVAATLLVGSAQPLSVKKAAVWWLRQRERELRQLLLHRRQRAVARHIGAADCHGPRRYGQRLHQAGFAHLSGRQDVTEIPLDQILIQFVVGAAHDLVG